jgi:hypothetical protein
MSYGVMIPTALAATNVDAWNRSCIAYTGEGAFENGGIVALTAKSTTAGQSELWSAYIPVTATLPYVWMVYDPELVWTGSYRGLDPDVRNYYVAEGRTFSAFLPQVHDLVLMDADCFTGAKGANTFANATNGSPQIVWGMSQSSTCFAMKYIATQYISIGTGAIDSQRVDAYLMEVIPQI